MKKKLALIVAVLILMGAGEAFAMAKRFDGMQCLNVAANVTCKSATPNKDPNFWTKEETEAYYKCYYTPCVSCWNQAGWKINPDSCCVPGVDCKNL